MIDWKWTRFCRRLLLWELAAFLLWLGAYAAWVLAVQAGSCWQWLKALWFRQCVHACGWHPLLPMWLGTHYSPSLALMLQGEDPHDSLHQLLRTPWGAVAVAADALCLLGMLPFLLLEASSMWAYGRGWLAAWSVLNATSVALQVGVAGKACMSCMRGPGEARVVCHTPLRHCYC